MGPQPATAIIAQGSPQAAPYAGGFSGPHKDEGSFASAGPNANLSQIALRPGDVPSFAEDTKGNYGLFGGDRLSKRPLMRVAAEIMECYDEKRAVAQLEATSRVAKAQDREVVAKRSARWQVEKACAASSARLEQEHNDKAAQGSLMSSRFSKAGTKCQQEMETSQTLTAVEQKDAEARKEGAEAWLRNAEAEAEAAIQKALARKEEAVRRAKKAEEDAVQHGKDMIARATGIATAAEKRFKTREEQELKRCEERLQAAKNEISRRRDKREQGTKMVLFQNSDREELARAHTTREQNLDSSDTATALNRLAAESTVTARHHGAEQDRMQRILNRSRKIAADLKILLDRLRLENFDAEQLQALEAAISEVQEPAAAEALGASVTEWRDAWRNAK